MTETVQRPPEAVALADWLVGPFSHAEQTRPGELAVWQVPFYDVALQGLRRVAGLSQDQELPRGFQPEPLQGVELYRELAYDRKAHGMINSLFTYISDYKNGTLDTQLRDHQQEIMDVLLREVVAVGADRQITIKSPTGTGKTAILTTLIEALKYKEQPNDRVRALVLLPSKDILAQTVKAFSKFTSIKAAVYYGESRQIGDVTAMTYQSFERALERGDITEDSFDLVARDEADTFARGKTGIRIDRYCHNPKTGRRKLMFGLTATPLEEHKLSYERTVLDSIRDRLLAPLSTYQRHSQLTVREGNDRDWREDFKESDLIHLMENEARNGIIIDEIKSGLASGRRVMVRCIPGKNLRHPNMLKNLLLEMGRVRVKHPFMGDVEYRPIRPVVIPGTMTMRQRELLTGIFNNHLDERIDVLLFVGTLIRGFDSPVAKKVINGPTLSAKLAEQLLGRVERWFEAYSGNVMDAQGVDIVDRTESGQITFEDIINRDAPEGMRYKPGAIIGPGLADLRYHNSAPDSAFMPIPPTELTMAARLLCANGLIQFDGINLHTANPETLPGRTATRLLGASALIKTARQISSSPHSDSVPLKEAATRLRITPADLMLTAHRHRIGLVTVRATEDSHPRHYFSPNAFARLQATLTPKSFPWSEPGDP